MTAAVLHELAPLTSAAAPEAAVPSLNELAVLEATQQMQRTTLEALTQQAELLCRVDRKYFVPVTTFRRFAELMVDDFAVLEVDGRRLFAYESVYFDSPCLTMYRMHLQGRRRRFKVRTRGYLDSGACMLEVKLKGRRSITEKMRTPYPIGHQRELTPEGLATAAAFVRERYGLELPAELTPVLTTSTRRATFASLTESARFTCDVGLRCSNSSRAVEADEGHVLVESKAGAAGSRVDRILHQLGVRSVPISKYCIGVAVTHPEIPSNPWHRTLRHYFQPSTSAAA